jgi:hypothetical protein
MSASGTKTASLEAQIHDLQGQLEEAQRRESVTRRNIALFAKLDFKAWNKQDWDLFRQLHAEDVRVIMGSMVTSTVDAHVEAMQAMLDSTTSRVMSHDIAFGNGDWTCCLATTCDSNSAGKEIESSICTVARWHNGRIAEKYLFIAPSV